MRRPLLTSVGSVSAAPLVLIDVETDQGITGRSYLFSYLDAVSPLIQRALDILLPSLIRQPVEPAELRKRAGQSLRLLGADGVFGLCLSGLDVAYWDALAKAADMPLARFLGGTCGRIQAYNSNGLGVMSPEAAASEALELLDEGYRAIKVRLGHPAAEDDLAVVRAIRAKIPTGALLMSDYNHCLSAPEAVRRARMLDGEGLYWIEEPTAPDDLPANAEVARSVSTPIQIGENFRTLREMQAAIDARACDLVMPDLERIGGVSGWLKAAAVAEDKRLRDVLASFSRGKQPPDDGDLNQSLARIRRLGGAHSLRAAHREGRLRDRSRAARKRPFVGRGRGAALRRGLTETGG